jgi:hypothetical protein
MAGRSYTLLQRVGAFVVKLIFFLLLTISNLHLSSFNGLYYELIIWFVSEEWCKTFCSGKYCLSGKFVMMRMYFFFSKTLAIYFDLLF